MLTATILADLVNAKMLAAKAGHPWPGIAAAEAALESATRIGWFTSSAYKLHNNALGITPGSTYKGNVFYSATHEFLPHGEMMPKAYLNPRQPVPIAGGVVWMVDRSFCSFPSLEDCFVEQVSILEHCPDYAPAWHCPTAECWCQLVSVHWASGPTRGNVVAEIYHAHLDVLGVQP